MFGSQLRNYHRILASIVFFAEQGTARICETKCKNIYSMYVYHMVGLKPMHMHGDMCVHARTQNMKHVDICWRWRDPEAYRAEILVVKQVPSVVGAPHAGKDHVCLKKRIPYR